QGADSLKKMGADAAAARKARLLRILAWGDGAAPEGPLVKDPTPYLSALSKDGKAATISSNELFAKLLHCAFQVDANPKGLGEVVGRLLGKPMIDLLNQVKSAEDLTAHLQEKARLHDGFRGMSNGVSRQMADKILAARDAQPGKKFE